MRSAQQKHRDFLNAYYGISRHFYDVTRAYYLFGRDRALERLLDENGEKAWESLIEVGPGTGRNLSKLHRARPAARLGGIEACDAMLDHAKKRCPWATLVQGFAEDVQFREVLALAPDRILFSYCLSMVEEPAVALENARRSISPSGQVVVVDFADLSGLRQPLRSGLQRWLRTFHVKPLDLDALGAAPSSIEHGPWHYYLVARYDSLS